MSDLPGPGGLPPTGAPIPILEARGLAFRHPGAAAPLFSGLTLRVDAREVVGIIGPNGSGKTTLLKILSGLLPAGAGEVTLAGRPVRALRPRQRAAILALVPQESRVLFDFTVLEVVLMGRAPRLGLWGLERPADFEAARAALREVDLAGEEDRPLSALSSGERQRALIARALAQEPRLLLLDEPTAFLDLKHRLQIHEILRRLNRRDGLTVVSVSHDLNLAALYCSRLVLLHHGLIVADGPSGEVLTAERVREVYETEVRVERDVESGAPFLVPRPPRF